VVSAPPPLQRVFTSGAALGELSPAATFTSAGWYPPLFFTPRHMAYDSGDHDRGQGSVAVPDRWITATAHSCPLFVSEMPSSVR
jgi:hypothetical protein